MKTKLMIKKIIKIFLTKGTIGGEDKNIKKQMCLWSNQQFQKLKVEKLKK